MRLVTLLAVLAALTAAGTSWAHDEEGRNFNATLRPAAGLEDGSGKIKFRQPRDEFKIVFLKVRVRGLAPNRSYYLERATDDLINDVCTGENWLRLGHGADVAAIETDDRGKGRAVLFRDLSALQEGRRFDIHFRVVDATGWAVLVSDCNQFTVLP